MKPRMGRVATLVVSIAALVAPAPAVAASLATDSLEVRVRDAPFALEFVDRADGDVLRSVGGGTPGPADPRARYGPLGFSVDLRAPLLNNSVFGYYRSLDVETLWFHATRVRSARAADGALELDVETNDPLGHRLAVSLRPVEGGGIALRSRLAPGSGPLASAGPTVSGAAFEVAGGERFLGFGERSNASDQTGNEVFNWAEEGPFSAGRYEEMLRRLIPDFTFPNGPTTTNFPVPWAVSTRGFGVLIDQSHRSRFRLASERSDAWQLEAEAPELRLTVFAGPKPVDVVRRYSAYAGRQPDPAPWIFGPWVQAPREILERFRAEDVPVSVNQTYTHYLPCGAQVGREAEEAENVRQAHSLGYRVTTYFNPHVCTSYSRVYDDAARRGLLVKNGLGRPYLLTNPFTADELVSEIDFTHPEGRALYQRLLDEAIDRGYDGWMEDFGEYTPSDSVFYDGRSGREMHNLYPVLYHGASTEYTLRRMGRNAAVFIRSGWHGVQPYARVVWGGDPTEDWSCSDGLCAAVNQLLSIGLSGIAYQGSDIGGFHAVVNDRTSDELNIRWLQVGAVSGVMRTQRNGYSFTQPRERRSQVWSPAVLPVWRRYAKLRTQLLPYLEAASRQYQRTGLPIARHLSLVYPDDPRARLREHEFMFGPSLLAAPVLRPGQRERRLYLPRGLWLDFNRATSYVERTGELRPRSAPLLAGSRDVTVPAPLGELPLLVRAGAVIPMLPPDVDTLADLDGAQGVVSLRDRRRRLRLLAFPRGVSRAALGAEGIVRSLERRARRWDVSISSRTRRRYDLHAALRTLRRPIRPCRVTLRGRRLSRRAWSYNRREGTLRVRFTAGRGTLRVQGRTPRGRCA